MPLLFLWINSVSLQSFFCTQTLNIHIFAIEFSHEECWHICGIKNGQINPIY